ncbi:hypothetical protein ACMXYV_02935 [Neptuniibacter sp. SY11_33]|uniref:hypothetical protein n=1 Tax=Neptuniibacter sp. SY11_33 TaxID=3398215 RepID=UPI0039F5095E
MNQINNEALELLDSLFPGNDRVPGFNQLEERSKLASSIKYLDQVVPLYLNVRGQLPDGGINEYLKLMKKDKSIKTQDFLESALEVYFSVPEVVRAATGAPVPLFPNQRVLPDVDFDLLEPVYIRMIAE